MIQKHLTMHHFEQPLKTWWSCHVEDGKFNIYNLTVIRKLDSVVFLSYTEYIWFTIHCYYYIPLNFVWKCFRYVLHEITTKMLTIHISSRYLNSRTDQTNLLLHTHHSEGTQGSLPISGLQHHLPDSHGQRE